MTITDFEIQNKFKSEIVSNYCITCCTSFLLVLAEEQLTLQQTKARLDIRLLKATLRQADLSTSDEEV